jgi:hypothetical protein
MNKLSGRRLLALAGGTTLIVMLAGCGSNPSSGDVTATTGGQAGSGSSSQSPAPSGDQSGSAGSGSTGSAGTATGSSASGPDHCRTGQLDAAGSSYYTLVLTNTGDGPCRIGGFSGVSFVGHGDGTQVGAAAARQQGDRADTFELQPGDKAAATLQEANAENYGSATCRPTRVDGLRIYPPDDTASLFVKQEGVTGCANPKVQLLFLGPYHAVQ